MLEGVRSRLFFKKFWAGLAELGAFPSVGEVFTLLGLDRLDAASIVLLQENTTAIFLFNQRQIFTVECELGVTFGERIHV